MENYFRKTGIGAEYGVFAGVFCTPGDCTYFCIRRNQFLGFIFADWNTPRDGYLCGQSWHLLFSRIQEDDTGNRDELCDCSVAFGWDSSGCRDQLLCIKASDCRAEYLRFAKCR